MRDEVLHLTVHFPDGAFGGLDCAPVGAAKYRLHQSQILLEDPLYLDDVVELEPRPDSAVTFVQRRVLSRLRRECYTLSRDQTGAPELDLFLAAETAAGGQWEVWFHGILLLHLPRESAFDPHRSWAGIVKSAPPEG